MKELIKEIAPKFTVTEFYTGGSVRWSSNGRLILSTCGNIVKAIDILNNNTKFSIGNDNDDLRITCICVNNSNNHVLVAFNNQVINEYTVPVEGVPELVRSWKTMHNAPVLVMEFNEDGILLATGSADHVVKIWDLQHQQCTHTLKGPSVVSAISFAMNDKISVGYIEGQINLFDLTKGVQKKLLKEWKSHTSHITSIVRIPETRKIVALSRDQTMSIHETETQETLKVLPLFESIESATIGYNGCLFTVGEEGSIKEWNIETAKMKRMLKVSGVALDYIEYDPINNRFLCTSAEHNLYVIGLDEFKLDKQIVGYQDEIYSCCLLGSNESHIAIASNTTDIKIYEKETMNCSLIPAHSESILGVVCPSWDRDFLASCSKDFSIVLWRFQKDGNPIIRPIAAATGHTGSVTSIAISNQQNNPFVVSVANDTMMKLWSIKNLKSVPYEGAHMDSKNLRDTLPKIKCSSTIVAHAKEINCIAVSDSDTLIATGGMDKLVKVWKIDVNKMQLGIYGTLSGHRRGVGDVKFAKKSNKVVSCSGDMTIKIWNINDLTCMQTLVGHTCAVFKVMFVSNDQQLISADSGGVLKIWTLKNNECESTIDGHNDKVWSLTTNSDETEFISAGSDSRIVVWRDVTEEKKYAEDEKRKRKIEEEQTLTNLLEHHRFEEALEYSLTLSRPYCSLRVVNCLIANGNLDKVIEKIDGSKKQTLMKFVTQWNTNSKTSQPAQKVLMGLLNVVPPEELLNWANAKNIIESLVPYTKRHMERLDKTKLESSLLNFVWKQMKVL